MIPSCSSYMCILFSANLLTFVQVTEGNRSVTISWRKLETAPPRAAYVVEWYPEGHMLEELRWVRLGRNDNRTVITGGACRVIANAGEITHLHHVFSGIHSYILPSFFMQVWSPSSATRGRCMLSIMGAQWAGPDLQVSPLWNQVRRANLLRSDT